MKRHIPKWWWVVWWLLVCLWVVFVWWTIWVRSSQRTASTVWHEIAQTRSHQLFRLGQFLTTRWPTKSLNYQIAWSIANPTMKSNSGSILLPFVATWSIDGSFQYEQLTGRWSMELMLDITYISWTTTLATYQISAPMTLVRSTQSLRIKPTKTLVNRSGLVIEDLIVWTALINEFADTWIQIPLSYPMPALLLPIFALADDQPSRHIRTTAAGEYVMNIEGDGLVFSGQLNQRDTLIWSFLMPRLGQLTILEQGNDAYAIFLEIPSFSWVTMEGELQYTKWWDRVTYTRKGNGLWWTDGLWNIGAGSSTVKKAPPLGEMSLPDQSIKRRTIEQSLFPTSTTSWSLSTVTEALTP